MHGNTTEGPRGSSQRLRAVQAPVIPIVAGWIREHPGTISLGQGVVYYGPPAGVGEAVSRCLADPANHIYKSVQGIPELRRAIAAKLEAENGIHADPDARIVVTAGANMGFMNAVPAIADPGDEIILLTPYYFNYEMAVNISGCRAVCVATDRDYQPQLDAIRAAITKRTRAIVTISPNNPTGVVYPEETIRAINALCGEAGIYHIHDEAYEYFTWDGARSFSPGSIPGSDAHTIELFSLSKAYGFASWRIGWMVIPEDLLGSVIKIQDTNLICPPVVSQHAAVAAMAEGRPCIEHELAEIAGARSLVHDQLETIADFCRTPPAAGAFYLLLQLDLDIPPMELARRLVAEHRVAGIPGSAFGVDESCSLRIAFGAMRRDDVAEAMGRLVRGLRAIREEIGGSAPSREAGTP